MFLSASIDKEQVRIVMDPYQDSIGLKLPSMEADVVLVSRDDADHNNATAVKGDPFLVTNPGEYDVKGVVIQGISSGAGTEGKKQAHNTIYVLEAEGLRLCHLGALGQKELTPEQVEKIGAIDILFVPVGGEEVIGAKEAGDIVQQIEPKMVIPIHFAIPKLKAKLEGVELFLKTIGKSGVEPQQKITVKLKDLMETELMVGVLKP